jgi:hypothetical protein
LLLHSQADYNVASWAKCIDLRKIKHFFVLLNFEKEMRLGLGQKNDPAQKDKICYNSRKELIPIQPLLGIR